MEVSGHLHNPAALPSEWTPVPIEEEAGWVPQSACRCWRRENYVGLVGIRALEHPVPSLVTTSTTLSQYLIAE